jgi:glutamine cyclotransferase
MISNAFPTPVRNFGKAGILFLSIFLLVVSCSGDSDRKNVADEVKKQGERRSDTKVSTEKISYIVKPEREEVFRRGDRVPVQLALVEGVKGIDSFQVFVDGGYQGVSYRDDLLFNWNSENIPVGQRTIKTVTFGRDGQRENNSVVVILHSDIAPEQYSYRILHTYPHDITAYTQGLVYEDGIMYESTGQRGESTLRKVNLETGELIESLNLPPNLFGEGACILDDKIIQLTWTSKVGFVYDKESFRVINRIEYPTQGWGLTTNGEQLIMSDGSHIIYFLEPDYFTELSRIEVFDHEKAITNLNELEYVDGKIYANIYKTDFIVVIEPETGRVLSQIDLKGLLNPEDVHDRIDVLNGIAYDAQNKRLFVTGKRWPKLYEIQLVKK